MFVILLSINEVNASSLSGRIWGNYWRKIMVLERKNPQLCLEKIPNNYSFL
jgi:hypothetical protein